MSDDLAARQARCIYCDHAYESERPSQWERLHHLHDCRPLPREAKPGLFHEAMAVLEQERAARQAVERLAKLETANRRVIEAAHDEAIAKWDAAEARAERLAAALARILDIADLESTGPDPMVYVCQMADVASQALAEEQ